MKLQFIFEYIFAEMVKQWN